MNMPNDETLASEKLCTVLFGRGIGTLKITVERHPACCMRQYYTSNSCPCATYLRSQAGDCMSPDYATKPCEYV